MFMTADHTVNGRSIQPLSVENLNYRAEMKIDSKKVLWENVSALMIDRYKKENLTKLAKESGVGPGTMTRIKDQETSVGVDVLEKLAAVARVEPWQLLTPNMGKGNLLQQIPQDYKQNHPLAPVNQAQEATNNVVSLDVALNSLTAYLAQVEPSRRESVVTLMASLVRTPDDDGLRAALTALLTPSGFADQHRLAA